MVSEPASVGFAGNIAREITSAARAEFAEATVGARIMATVSSWRTVPLNCELAERCECIRHRMKRI